MLPNLKSNKPKYLRFFFKLHWNMSIKCRLCLFKTERDEFVNIFSPGKNNELISDTIMSFFPIEVILL
jgi:hypothetical protein